MKKVPYSYSTSPDVYWKARIKCDREESSISKKIHNFLVDFVEGELEVAIDAQGKLVPSSPQQDLTIATHEQPPAAALHGPLNGTISEDLPPAAALPESEVKEAFTDHGLSAESEKDEEERGQESLETITIQPEQVTLKKETGLKKGQAQQKKKKSQPAPKVAVAKGPVYTKVVKLPS